MGRVGLSNSDIYYSLYSTGHTQKEIFFGHVVVWAVEWAPGYIKRVRWYLNGSSGGESCWMSPFRALQPLRSCTMYTHKFSKKCLHFFCISIILIFCIFLESDLSLRIILSVLPSETSVTNILIRFKRLNTYFLYVHMMSTCMHNVNVYSLLIRSI